MSIKCKRLSVAALQLALLGSSVAISQDDIILVPPVGGAFKVMDSQGNTSILEVTGDGRVSVNGKELDLQPPVIEISAPSQTTTGIESVKVTVSDDQGLLRVQSTAGTYSEDKLLFGGEQSATLEYDVIMDLGQDTVVTAYAVDAAGNGSAATHTIRYSTAIVDGRYSLDTELDVSLSGSGCAMDAQSPIRYRASEIVVQSRYRGDTACDVTDENEDPAALACVSISVVDETDDYVLANLAIDYALPSFAEASFSKTQLQGTQGSRLGIDYAYATLDVQFLDSTPPSIRVSASVKCETRTGDTETWGPWELTGTR